VLGGVADHDAQLASFTAIDIDLRDHLRGIQVEAVGLRAVHDAQPTALLGGAFLIDHLRNVIHAT
jgi:hypothetical protein